MKKIFTMAIAIWLLAACAPVQPTPAPITSLPTEHQYLFSIHTGTTRRVGGTAYEFDHKWMGIPTFDCNPGVYSTNQSYPFILVRWILDSHPVSFSSTHPSQGPYMDFVIRGDGEGPIEIERADIVRFKSDTLGMGPCGSLVGEGWIYTDTNFHDASVEYNEPEYQGTIILPSTYVTDGTFPQDLEVNSGFWRVDSLNQVVLYWDSHGQLYGSCYLWYSVVGYTFFDVTNNTPVPFQLGNEIALFAPTYPPTQISTVKGIGSRQLASHYVIVSLPPECAP